MKKLILFIGFFLSAQLSAEVVDKIVAVVGDKVITQSEVEEAVFLFPGSDKESILKGIIERELLLVEAKKETLEVSADELSDAVEKAILEVQGKFPSDEEYIRELQKAGMSEEDLRTKYAKEIEKKMLVQKLIQSKFGKDLVVSDVEGLNFYTTNLDSIPLLPDAIKCLGVMVYYPISDNSREVAKKRVDKIMESINAKKEAFSVLAEKYSDDPISGKKGGNLGGVSIKDLGEEFQTGVKDMVIGEVAIVPSNNTYHIVKCNERQGEMISISDIVIKVVPTSVDSQSVQEEVDSVSAIMALLSDSIMTEDIVWGNKTQVFSDGKVFIPLSATTFESLEAVEIGKIYIFNTADGIQVVKPLEKRVKHTPMWEEIRDELKNVVYQRKLQSRYEKLINRLKEEVFVIVLQ
ncbi:MAG: peptidylprolyl isomerase [Candidatus Stahlbacteria bacterium]|nr:peptidylprolyl isomerase [Candidatus Stahlbacteria bacterium]